MRAERGMERERRGWGERKRGERGMRRTEWRKRDWGGRKGGDRTDTVPARTP
jgi:hypothetical protein